MYRLITRLTVSRAISPECSRLFSSIPDFFRTRIREKSIQRVSSVSRGIECNALNCK